MRLATMASLVCAASLCSAAAGQGVAAVSDSISRETGIQCFSRLCNFHGDSLANRKRRCYTCCTANCQPNAIDCQDGCDRMKGGRDSDGQHDHNEQGSLWKVYSEPMFDERTLGDDAACILLVGMLGSINDTDIRFSIVVAAERLENCEMPADTRDALRDAIIYDARDFDICWKPRMTAVNAIGDVLTHDVLAVAALFEIVWDAKEEADVRIRAEEILESL